MTFNPFSAAFRRDPYPSYREVREQPGLHRTLGTWVVTRHADVRAALRDRTFSAGLIPSLVARQADRLTGADVDRISRLGAKSLVFTDNPDHARLRGLLNRVFTTPALTALHPLVQRVTGELVDDVWDHGEADAIAALATPLPLRVLCDWMALPDDLRKDVQGWTRDVRYLLEPGLLTAADLTRVSRAVETFAAALDTVVSARRAEPGADLISRMASIETATCDRLTDEELTFLCIMCFVAGTETTRALIGNGLLAMLTHPGAAPNIDEMLRYDSPLQLTKRLATQDVEIAGTTIRAGDQVLLCIGAANRDPAVFTDPDVFDPRRDARAHLAFGHGMHGCLGGILAALIARTAFTELLRRPGHLVLAADPLWQTESVIVRGLEQLPVTVEAP